MELTDETIGEIRQAEYGKVTIEIENRGNEPSLDIVITARRRFQKSVPTPGKWESIGRG
jgi:hypothetical protein